MVQLAWNAVATKVNAQGQVEGTCVGTGMGFDPAFYYYRPTSVLAAHGYGPVLLAGAEMIRSQEQPGGDQRRRFAIRQTTRQHAIRQVSRRARRFHPPLVKG